MSPVKTRKALLERKSKETEIKVDLNIDGQGKTKIKTPIGILSHMLELFAFHGLFDLNLEVKKADLKIDIHHTNEDIGIVLGKAFQKALGKKEGIRRFGFAAAPMEDVVTYFVIDISGRGHHKIDVEGLTPQSSGDGYTFTYFEHFIESFAKSLGANINIKINNPMNSTADIHTVLETIFKSFGLALDQATQIDPRRKGNIPSTKGVID